MELENEESITRVLVVGAGGLGCEVIRNLIMINILHIEVVDIDTVEVSNLSRQMLYSFRDIGRAKAVVATEYIARKFPHCFAKSHVVAIESFPQEFYRLFDFVISALDNVKSRVYLNRMIMSLAEYGEDNLRISHSCPILIDGGTEGLKGHARIVIHGVLPCLECFYDLFQKEEKYAVCSVSGKLRRPDQCVHYARLILWDKEDPFDGAEFNETDANHIKWIHKKASEAAQTNGFDVDLKLVQDILTNTVPAVASTQTVVACLCVRFLQRILQKKPIEENFINVNTSHGIYYNSERLSVNDQCDVCSTKCYLIDCQKYGVMGRLFERMRTILEEQMISSSNLFLIHPTSSYSLVNAELEELYKERRVEEFKNYQLVAICKETKRKILIGIHPK